MFGLLVFGETVEGGGGSSSPRLAGSAQRTRAIGGRVEHRTAVEDCWQAVASEEQGGSLQTPD